MEIFSAPDKQTAYAEAGEHLNAVLVENKKKPILLMLSGGSCLGMLEYVGKMAMGENLTISMLDDRFTHDENANNFAQLQHTDFYKDALETESSFFGTMPRKEDTLETKSKRWEEHLKKWREENSSGLVIATLGMGADGHTAGIFPHNDENEFNTRFNSSAWMAAYNVGEKSEYKERITSTITFLRMVDFAIAFVAGQEKKAKLTELKEKKGKLNEFPALVWHDIKDVKVFTDIK